MKLQIGILSLVFLVSFGVGSDADPPLPRPLWGETGLAINNTPGNTPQTNPKLSATVDGALALVWEDGRNGYTNIYAQKFDSAGSRLWADAGVQVSGGKSGLDNQNNPSLIEDGAGGLIVVWQGYYKGGADIYAQRVDKSGQLLWGTDGLIISDAAAGQFAPELVSDGAGGALITWYDNRGGAGEDIYAQRVDKSGQLLWEKNGSPICDLPGTQWYPKISSDGGGGAIIVWSDGRASSSDNNIYAQRVDGGGKLLWEKDGSAVSAAAQNQEKPVITATEGGAVIAWQDSRSGNVDLYAQKIDLSGKPLWAADGVALATARYGQEDPRLSPNGRGGAIFVWTDNRADESGIYMQSVSADGRIEWGDNGRQAAKGPARQENPVLIRLKTLDWAVVWEDSRKGTPLLYAQKINSAGVQLWPEGGIALSAGGRSEEKATAAVLPDGQLVVGWQDSRSGENDIYGQKVLADGSLAWTDNGLVLNNAPGSVIHQNAAMIESGKGEVIVVFEDARPGFLNIYVQKIDRAGNVLWGKGAVPVAPIKADQRRPQLAPDGAGGAIIVWEDQRDPTSTNIYAQRISAQGKKVWAGGSLPLAKGGARQSAPTVVTDRAGGAIVVWQDERNPLGLKDLYGQRVSPAGEPLWGSKGVLINGENGDQTEQALIPDGAGGALLAWTDYRRGERNPDIYAQHIDPAGKLLWQEDGLLVCGAPDVQKSPSIARDADGTVLVAWTDKGGGSYDIYAQGIGPDGRILWLTDGIPVSQSPRTQQEPDISRRKTIAWEDYRYGNWDIYANAVSAQGKLIWGEDGAPVVSLPLTQYAPQIIDWKDESAIVAWEDYRNGKQYEIYLQLLDGDGKPRWPENGFLVRTMNGARAPKLLALPEQSVFVVIWEDYTGGGKAISGQMYSLD
ncbi:hypothetical protein A2625_04110 [candidate division WOR-1 bacterium RIFCSPHIGHO2_01_FULL_53_15]|uniref:Bulb-type lectin domain-containing protein n=1 Tax=candidate division WOR-1 bacterium RIFCSPHIGHO2_01_FULL_53_15 TaxID=1802564 RepID=A0A1F4PZX0_UNCSA|nr:MAG: hypothetical protein A2625_04110 [candidate division WOR-1 bacterium RIFCSPHIGHO2_01_FULL_53_15]OGC12954.1 MAG: hypothetical protein A3D23_05140 [candidate division WOR-1 bacterium RIFCSPHIGHO2_02_FULL_53_26]